MVTFREVWDVCAIVEAELLIGVEVDSCQPGLQTSTWCGLASAGEMNKGRVLEANYQPHLGLPAKSM